MFKEINTLKPFLEEPNKEFNVRELARLLNIAPATASKKLKYFTKNKILKQREERMLLLYKADLDSEFYKDLKIYYNIRKIKKSGLIEILNKFYLKPSITLFGSTATGLDTKTSDIDLFVETEQKSQIKELKTFEKKINRTLQILTASDIKKLKNPHLINNILNGITIQGTLKWI
ncbi:MAG: nucleotidyltransferase domain-containing protein [Nanoarchaeota archaeon]|nr:nucleotidyltransferase domain-containing protein [Nanoarchaeota archaeon]